MRSALTAAFPVVLISLASSAFAQGVRCPDACGVPRPVWPAVVLSGPTHVMAVFDEDGAGPNPARLFIAGGLVAAGQSIVGNIARWDGASFSPVGAGVSGPDLTGNIDSMVVHNNGAGAALYVLGNLTGAGGAPAPGFARWTGAAWQALPAAPPPPPGLFGGYYRLLGVLPAPSGEQLFVAVSYTDFSGECGSIQTYRLVGASLIPAGAPISSDFATAMVAFDPDGDGPAPSSLYMTTQSYSTHSCAGQVGRLLRFDGTSWQQIASKEGGFFSTLAVSRAGGALRLYLGGQFDSVAPASGAAVAANSIVSFDGTGFAPLGVGLFEGTLGTASASVLAPFDADGAGPAPEVLVVLGRFFQAGGVNVTNAAQWDGAAWSSFGGGVDSASSAIQFDPDAPGPQMPYLAVSGLSNAGGMGAHGFAAYRAGDWAGPSQGPSGTVTTLAIYKDVALYAGGSFDHAGSAAASNVARWDGADWSPLGGGVAGPVNALLPHNDGHGFALFAGGDFQGAGGAFASRIARWNGSAWSAVGAGIGGPVYALEVFDTDGAGPLPAALYAGGDFQSAGGGSASRIARWDGTQWSSLGTGLNGVVYALKTFNDGAGPALYAGGAFTTAGGLSSRAVAKWTGSAWVAMPGIAAGETRAFGIFDAGQGYQLFAGGYYGSALVQRWTGTNFQPAPNPPLSVQITAVRAMRNFDDGTGPALLIAGTGGDIARFNGTSWTALGARANGAVLAFSVPFNLGCGPAVYAAGDFTLLGPDPATRVAAIVSRASGSCPCYANCDASAIPPLLNVLDFTCFLQKFAANDLYANCDHSATPPLLNVLDFTCFLQKYAAGCP